CNVQEYLDPGIGCHVMATAIYTEFNKLTTHMGGEGAPWIGQAAFSQFCRATPIARRCQSTLRCTTAKIWIRC
ncbi:MAG: hypothetical protein ACKOAO_06525, partial [Oxalobacteraceae bacterium]